MKRSIYILLILLTVYSFSGCIREDMSRCLPEMNMDLLFSYMGDTDDPEMFGNSIDRVHLYVLDDRDASVFSAIYEKEDLLAYQGARFSLEPGNYQIVCWGNAFDNTELTGEEGASGCIHHPCFVSGECIPTNDHLYYGCYDVVVPATKASPSGEIEFEGAHIDMRVYVRYAVSGSTPEKWPIIEVHNLMPQYDMGKLPLQEPTTTYYPVMGYNNERKLNQSFFQVLQFPDDNPVTVEVKSPAGESLFVVGLKEYMADNNITVEGKHEAMVPILIEFTNLGVVLSVPEWEIVSVDPEP